MAEEKDKTHRLLFQFPRLIRDLVVLCLDGEWTERLDFSTLEQIPERLLTPELARREQDVLWRVAYRSPSSATDAEYFYIYLHIEHQSRPRPFMALDMLCYKALILQHLVRSRQITRRRGRRSRILPTILSIVYYDGDRPWHEPSSILDLLQPVEGLPEGLDFWSYRLIDGQRIDLTNLLDSDSPLLGVFRLERLDALEDLSPTMRSLRETLSPEEQELRQAVTTFINEVVLPRLTPKHLEPLRIRDLEEEPTMFAQRLERLVEDLKTRSAQEGRAEGIQEGMQKGIQKGMQEGRTGLLRHQLEKKFGQIPPEVFTRMKQADGDQILSWSERVLTARTLNDVFE